MQKVSFFIRDIDNDLMVAINGTQEGPITISDWICSNSLGTMWSELDMNGFPVFCMYSAAFTNNTVSMTDSNGNNPYTVEGCYFKDHPIHAPK